MQLEKDLMGHTCVLNFNVCYFFPLFDTINHISAAMMDGCQWRPIRLIDLKGLSSFYQYEKTADGTRARHSSFHILRQWITKIKYPSSLPTSN